MMKLKSNQTRTYDGDGYKKRAACLCFRSETEEEVRPGICVHSASSRFNQMNVYSSQARLGYIFTFFDLVRSNDEILGFSDNY